jgi:hypothetical protein
MRIVENAVTMGCVGSSNFRTDGGSDVMLVYAGERGMNKMGKLS